MIVQWLNVGLILVISSELDGFQVGTLLYNFLKIDGRWQHWHSQLAFVEKILHRVYGFKVKTILNGVFHCLIAPVSYRHYDFFIFVNKQLPSSSSKFFSLLIIANREA